MQEAADFSSGLLHLGAFAYFPFAAKLYIMYSRQEVAAAFQSCRKKMNVA